MNDILEPEISNWQRLESCVHLRCGNYGYSEIRTPIVESTELFKRGVGDDTDIVQKEMYSFMDRNEESLTLRPEGTASVVRAITQHSLFQDGNILKFYYIGPMFRYERPQKGRYRQFYQFGIEYVGSAHPYSDVEVMALQASVFRALGLERDIKLHISSVGCESCRPAYKLKLLEAIQKFQNQLPDDVKARLESNPQRIFDHKDEKVKALTVGLPVMLENLCGVCRTHLTEVEKGLKLSRVDFAIDPFIVRGLDYYTQTAFEFVTDKLGAQSAVCGGGRYNKLIESLGGPQAPAVGLGMGMERIVLLMTQKAEANSRRIDVAVVYPDEKGRDSSFVLCEELRQKGISSDIDFSGRSMKSQMKRADRLKARYVAIQGGSEIERGLVVVRDMATHDQTEISRGAVLAYFEGKNRGPS